MAQLDSLFLLHVEWFLFKIKYTYFKRCLSCIANLDCIEISKVTFQSKQCKKKSCILIWHALTETRTSVYYIKLQRPIYRSLKGWISLFLSIPLTRLFLPSYTLLVIQMSLAIHFLRHAQFSFNEPREYLLSSFCGDGADYLFCL